MDTSLLETYVLCNILLTHVIIAMSAMVWGSFLFLSDKECICVRGVMLPLSRARACYTKRHALKIGLCRYFEQLIW